jgi:antitoxin ParD1/3/4
MLVTLNPELEALVRQKVDSGDFTDEASVVEEALLLLEKRDRLRRLRESLDLADEQIDRGEGVEWTPDHLDRLTAEAKENSRRGKPISDDVKP